ncbi:lactoylglutathione lyase [Ochrobactrum sp. MYb15]|uniref:VOC family protein n=1 Tax=Brucella TaxID=234 RepID=UPI000466833A|nr:VOC family protein [Brucella rhizosphaerae]PQZ49100.1 lactoylglutathione lyase [Ochrobactrum sp. MYb19]PRA57694.1 lactoylglutathione lyase [Ochrobactrum sp. MYb68]PRA67081.1 lactoylglutathione lyase [Ochrobactrum sp. MYb18]PRA75888.1 lactoylglutathione lyase [Brucella thiophenivorans]PRA92092.1 lactoylglutathione lyase [Ochrobactrum sp. MYb14]PRA97894.1 lactoylglutathione lyase [Ochrobactrum sp. MYb15]
MAKAIHTMIRVLDERKSVSFYDQAFGLKIAERIDFESFTLVYLRNEEADFEVELTINKGRTEAYNLGDGYGHLAFVVDDLDAEHTRFSELGFKVGKLVDFKNGDVQVARFFFVEDPDGYKIEVIQRGGRYQ